MKSTHVNSPPPPKKKASLKKSTPHFGFYLEDFHSPTPLSPTVSISLKIVLSIYERDSSDKNLSY